MVQTDPDELVEDAEIEGLPKRSGFLSFLLGLALGGVTSAAVLLGLSLSHPLPRDLPGIGNVRIEGSQAATAPTQVVIAEQTSASNVTTQVPSSTDTTSAEKDAVTPDGVRSDDAESAPASLSDSGAETVAAETSEDVTATITTESADGDAQQVQTSGTEPSVGESTTASEISSQITSQDTLQGASQTEPAETEQAETTSPQAVEETTDPDLQVAAVTPTEPLQPADPVPEVPELNLSGPAIEVNARAFDAPPNAPLLAIVLEDAGNGALETDALTLMTMPLTLAIRPEGAESTALAEAARSAKHEILVQLPFARSDAEQSAEYLHLDMSDPDRNNLTHRNLAQLPGAIGVVPPDGATLLNDAQAMRSVIEPLEKHGFAFIDVTAGSGSKVEALARAAGLSYSETSRYVPEGATDQQVFTSLESAAFQARQRGTAIVQINASRAALTAILRWGLEQDRRPVWFAPVSAVLKRQAATQ